MNTASAPDVEVISQIVFSPDLRLSQTAAEAILQLHFSNAALEEISRLREKNGDGTLSSSEYQKLDSYRRAGHLLDLIRAQAQAVLGKGTAN